MIPDNFIFNFDWDNKEKIPQKGTFLRGDHSSKKETEARTLHLKIEIDSSDVSTRNNIWEIRQSSISIDSGTTHIDRFIVASRNNSYTIDGTISGNTRDTLRLEFKGIDLSPLNQIR